MSKLNCSVNNIELRENKISDGDALLGSSSAEHYISSLAFNEALNTSNERLSESFTQAINTAVTTVMNNVFPIGYILTTFDSGDYSDYLGFRWEKLENTFLYADGAKAVGEVGGEETHVLTTNEIPWHTHSQMLNCNYGGGTRTISGQFIIESPAYVSWQAAARNNINQGYAGETGGLGGTRAHNNMPPFTVVRMWRRVA